MIDKKTGCAICGRPIEAQWRPFCSKRCADVDLGRWFGERYAVPDAGEEDESSEDETDDGGAFPRGGGKPH